MLLVFLLFTALFLSLFILWLTWRLGRHVIGCTAEQLIQQRERGSLAVDLIIVTVVTAVPLTKHAAHFIAEQVQIFFRNSHLLNRLVDLGDSQTTGTF